MTDKITVELTVDELRWTLSCLEHCRFMSWEYDSPLEDEDNLNVLISKLKNNQPGGE